MSYKMDYRSLKDMQKSVKEDITAWNEALTHFYKQLGNLTQSNSIKGSGADAVKNYLSVIHQQALIPAIGQLIETYYYHFEVYYNDYINNLDTNSDARFHESEFSEIQDSLKTLKDSCKSVEDEVIKTLSGISDIFSCGRRDISDVLGLTKEIKKSVNTLDTNIQTLENSHTASDFSDLNSAISSIRAVINECKSKPRSFKESFDSTSFLGLSSAASFIQTSMKISDDLQRNEQKYIEATENVEKHVQEIEAQEKAERERIATWIKIGVAVVAGAAVIIATGGGAAPVVVGLVSAGTAMASTAANEMLDEYVERGNLNQMDWGKMGKDCAVSGAVGFITGYVGGGISKTMKEVGPISKLVSSDNPIMRIAGNTAIGTTKSIIGNAVSEGGEWAKSGFKEYHAERIIGIEEGESVNAGTITKSVLKTVGSNAVESSIGEGFDAIKEAKSGTFNSGNTAARVMKNAAFGSTKEVVTGMGTRATEAAFDGEGAKHVFKETFDKQEIIKDTIKGGVEEGYSGAKNPAEGKEIYKKTYYTREENGEVVRIQNKDGSDRYRIDRNDTYSDVKSPKGIEYDRQYIRNGGKIVADSRGNVIYKDSNKTQYDIDHPIKSALKRSFITGDAPKNTSFYDANGKYDPSRSSQDYRGISVGKIPDFMPGESDSSASYQADVHFKTYNDTVWTPVVSI